jgi:hypothetical protein
MEPRWNTPSESDWHEVDHAIAANKKVTELQLRQTLDEIRRHSPGLFHILMALSPKGTVSPIHGQN